MSTATPRVKVGKLSLVFLNGPQCMSKPLVFHAQAAAGLADAP